MINLMPMCMILISKLSFSLFILLFLLLVLPSLTILYDLGYKNLSERMRKYSECILLLSVALTYYNRQ